MSKSWVAAARHHERVTIADRATEDRARAFHVGPAPVHVSHLVAVALHGRRGA